MNDKDKLRKLKVLMGNSFIMVRFFHSWKKIDIEQAKLHKTTNERYEIYKLGEELKISDNDLLKMWVDIYETRRRQKDLYHLKPIQERKDNKHTCVGSGGRNRTMVRYPSKKRSRTTWKRFYLLFPSLAEEDNWDGKISDKMK